MLGRIGWSLCGIATGLMVCSPSLLVAAALPAHPGTVAPRPNILVILADDLGVGDLGCAGAEDLRTPHLDRLFAEGLTFDRFYANSCVCSPTRAALLTGCYPERVGVPGVIRTPQADNWGYLAPGIETLPERLRSVGYRTALVGKWHLGLESPNLPEERGFQHFDGFLGDMMDDYYHHRRHGVGYLRRSGQAVEGQGHATDLFTQWACERLEDLAASESPFFLELAYNAPHTPLQPSQDTLNRVLAREHGIENNRAKLVAMIEHMDAGIGRILQRLEELGLADSTIVIFSSDNGGQLDVGASNGSWRDGKQSLYEGGIRVPCCVRWPAVTAAGSHCSTAVITMDLVPTLCAAAGVSPPQDIDGVDLTPALKGQADELPSRALFFHRREGGTRYAGLTIQAAIEGNWKLVQNSPFAPRELYNLDEDPRETRDLSHEEPERLEQLARALMLHTQRGGAVPWQKPTTRQE